MSSEEREEGIGSRKKVGKSSIYWFTVSIAVEQKGGNKYLWSAFKQEDLHVNSTRGHGANAKNIEGI